MSEPVLTATLLTPISIRLAWTYAGGSADFEVFWKSDHPAGQEYALLGRTTALTYDVGSLSWTTTYYFKVRAVSGATYGAFSNEVSLFVCCGQAVMLGAPPPGGGIPPTEMIYATYWQQSVDVDIGKVAMAVKTIDDTDMLLYSNESAGLYYLGESAYWNQFQAAVRRVGNKIAVFDMQSATYVVTDFGWYRFSYWNGSGFISSRLPCHSLHEINTDYGPNDFFGWFAISLPSVTQSMEYNDNGRIVIGINYIDWYAYPSYNVFALMYSNDYGATWSEEINIKDFMSSDSMKIAITETDDQVIWITVAIYDKAVDASWTNKPVYAVYEIYKWTLAGGIVFQFSITTELTNTYLGSPTYALIDPALIVAQCSIYSEGGKIVLAYSNKHTLTGAGTPWWGIVDVYTKVSNDYGATWGAPVLVSFSDVVLQASNWRATTPVVCISNGNLLLFVYGGTSGANKYYILRSTNNGTSWSVVYEFPGIVANFGYDAQMRSDGDHVVFSGCGMTVGGGNPLAYFESLDAGATWAAVDLVPVPVLQILVPA